MNRATRRKEIELYRKSLLASVKRFAKDINSKYLAPPATEFWNYVFANGRTLFRSGSQSRVFDGLRRDERIIVAGHLPCQPCLTLSLSWL